MRAVLTVLVVGCTLPTVSFAADTRLADNIAQRMTREALAAGAAGDAELRSKLLEQATTVAPEFAPARWAQGQMQVDGQWQAVGKVQQAAQADPHVQEYRDLRSAANSPQQHLELAKWCQQRELADEARYHWLQVLSADPNHAEALAALDSVWFGGQLVSPQQAAQMEAEAAERKKHNREWKTRITAWERELSKGPDSAAHALAEVDSEVDETAIYAFERLAKGNQYTKPSDRARQLQLCKAFLDALAQMPSYEATVSLLRHAVLADDDSLRALATTHLADRPLYECVPLLIEGLSAPIESHYAVRVTPTGRISYEHEFFTEGADGNYVMERNWSGGARAVLRPDWNDGIITPEVHQRNVREMRIGVETARKERSRQLHQANISAQTAEAQIRKANQIHLARNKRIVAALESLTDQRLGDNPMHWWSYWKKFNHYEVTDRPTYSHRDSKDYQKTYVVRLRTNKSISCFAAGTPVWTKSGIAPIESLAEGDLVLSRDVETGELCFKPVLATTVREPSPMIAFVCGSHSVEATLGHPFWVPGEGWQMAKELTAGGRIQAVNGPVRVDSTTKLADAEAYNLVVEGTNNYFVGTEGLLVHDNTERRPDRVRLGTW